MKKTTLKLMASILCVLLLVSLAGCGKKNDIGTMPVAPGLVETDSDVSDSNQTTTAETHRTTVKSGESADTSLIGKWQCVKQDSIDGAEHNFIYILTFSDPNLVAYTVGWDESEVANAFEGQYSININMLSLNMVMTYDFDNPELADDGSVTPINPIVSFVISGNNLTLFQHSGDALSYFISADVPMVFTKIG